MNWVAALVVLGSVWGGFSEELYWPEAFRYPGLAAFACGIAVLAPHANAPAVRLGILAVTGIVLVFRPGQIRARASGRATIIHHFEYPQFGKNR
jgi:glycosyltransferase involved in cell wall biosynthesis